jgi:hypothetical protein
MLAQHDCLDGKLELCTTRSSSHPLPLLGFCTFPSPLIHTFCMPFLARLVRASQLRTRAERSLGRICTLSFRTHEAHAPPRAAATSFPGAHRTAHQIRCRSECLGLATSLSFHLVPFPFSDAAPLAHTLPGRGARTTRSGCRSAFSWLLVSGFKSFGSEVKGLEGRVSTVSRIFALFDIDASCPEPLPYSDL